MDGCEKKKKIAWHARVQVPLLCWLGCLLYSSFLWGRAYSPDSYAYHMLGDHLISGQGYWSTAIRENIVGERFDARTFPPLLPIICGAINALFHTGIVSGALFNLIILFGIVCFLSEINRVLGQRKPVFCLGFLSFFIMTPSFMEEVVAGRAIPLSAFLLIAILYVIIRSYTISFAKGMVIGVLLGLMYLTRFDTTLFCFALPLFLVLIGRARGTAMLAMYGSFLVVVSPWIISNYIAFHGHTSANQSLMVYSVYEGNPILEFQKGGIPTGFSDPGLWLVQRIWATLRAVFFYILMLIVVLFPFGCVSLCKRLLQEGAVDAAGSVVIRTFSLMTFLLVSGLWVVTNISLLALTKNILFRYLGISVLLTLLCLLQWKEQKRGVFAGMDEHEVCTVKPYVFGTALVMLVVGIISPQLRDRFAFQYRDICRQFDSIIGKELMVASEGPAGADPMAYYCGWKTIYKPYNTNSVDDNFVAWKQAFDVRYMIADPASPFTKEVGIKTIATSAYRVLLDLQDIH